MEKKILVEVSARHVHVSREDLDTLFGKGYQLTEKKPLSQPGQFAAEERVKVVGPKRSLERVSILGPERSKTQVEISLTDAFSTGIKAPVRQSGDTEGSAGCTLVGPEGKVELEEGVIVAKRHIHMTPEDAKAYDLHDGEIVSVRVDTEDRALTFSDVVLRVRDDFQSAMHIDTDEGNAAGVGKNQYGVIE